MLYGFDLRTSDTNPFAKWVPDGRALLEAAWPKERRGLDQYLSDGVLDGDAIKNEWFGKTSAHVFVSHSHADEDIAIGLAGFLHESFGLLTFVDSLIWGDSRKLLRRIDKAHAWSDERNVFDYEQRNYTTSHVHMMLATSLTAAMDSCECLMFLNTPASLSITDALSPDAGRVATDSPWIYHELMTSSVMRRKPDPRRSTTRHTALDAQTISLEEANFKAAYRLELGHLKSLHIPDLKVWAGRDLSGFAALDWIYAQPGPPAGKQARIKSFATFLAK